jgi:glycosyltransferase involved in cell wall biosynthesis
MSDDERETWRFRAMKRVEERYSWDRVTTDYENLLTGLAKGTARA